MNVLIKLLSIGVSVAAGACARKGLEAGWRKGTGHVPPKEAGDLKNPLPGVLAFALATAVTGAIIQVLTQRLARKMTIELEHNPGEV